ncbi:DUF4156 domain-containing protein [Myxococcus sp. Y35]|uniref:DUF4156 domain-containing protein n=1 Tax=Pseudomyxococcus flavus TaxID=3115648 RepID=UPI003CF0A50E
MSFRITMLAAVALLTGCATASLNAAGSRVVAAPNLNVDGCKFLGTVIGQGGGAFGGGYISNDQLMQYAMNDAQNKAAALGATHLQTTAPQLGGASGTTTTATVTGSAFACVAKGPSEDAKPVTATPEAAPETAPAATASDSVQ